MCSAVTQLSWFALSTLIYLRTFRKSLSCFVHFAVEDKYSCISITVASFLYNDEITVNDMLEF